MRSSRRIIIHKHRKDAEKRARPIKFLQGLGLSLLGLILILLTGCGVFFAIFTQSLPSLTIFEQKYSSKPGPTRFFARDGETLLFTLAYENFTPSDLSICQEEDVHCFPATFLNAARITRETAVKQGEKFTLAEEMIRDTYTNFLSESHYPDLSAKLLAFQIRQTYGDRQLETWYYNHAWFGQMAFGLDAAAKLYLDKPAEELNDAECVLMSAIVNAPMLNPIDSKGALRDFYLQELASLQRAGLFNSDQADELARSNFVIFEPPHYLNNTEPDIITRKALNYLINLYGREQVERGGMDIITSEDVSLRDYLTCLTTPTEEENTSCPLSSAYSEQQIQTAAAALKTAPVSIAIMDVKSGQILAEMEAASDRNSNRIFEPSLRTYPIGSMMNVFAAVTAFSGGSSPSTLLWDLENQYTNPQLDTVSEPFSGPLQLRDALSQDHQRALNAHMQRFGSSAVQRNAALFGITGSTQSQSDSDTILNQQENINAETLAYAMIPFANLGRQTGSEISGVMQPVTILRIEQSDGTAIYPQQETGKSLINENLAFLVHDVFSQKTGALSLPDRPSAAKIGSSAKDSGKWISGYTTALSISMHVDEPQIVSAFVSDEDRVTETAEILWRSVMEYAHKELPVSGWQTPPGISQVRVCLPSGKLPTAACRETATELFLQGNEPYEYDEYYTEVPINRQNRLLATRFTPPEDVINEIFLNLPGEASEWAAANGIEQVPNAYDPIKKRNPQRFITIESPEEFQMFSQDEKINVIVRLALHELPETMQVSIGTGMYPTKWQEVCSGGSLENGQWLLCTLEASELDPGLYCLRTAFTLPNQVYQSAETYFQIN